MESPKLGEDIKQRLQQLQKGWKPAGSGKSFGMIKGDKKPKTTKTNVTPAVETVIDSSNGHVEVDETGPRISD